MDTLQRCTQPRTGISGTLTKIRLSVWFSTYSSANYGARPVPQIDQPDSRAWPVKVRVVARTFLDPLKVAGGWMILTELAGCLVRRYGDCEGAGARRSWGVLLFVAGHTVRCACRPRPQKFAPPIRTFYPGVRIVVAPDKLREKTHPECSGLRS